ncbi:MAG: hypothetical protein ABSE99_08340 [Terracidiphilus sp.]|jgi:hypothetical protein
MLEKLAGRLKWEQTGQGIRVEIPARCDWFVVIGGSILAVIALFSTSIGAMSLIFENPNSTRWLSTLGLLVLECLALSVLAWNFKGKTTLLLDPSEMKLLRHVLGIHWRACTFATKDVRNLRYLPSSGLRISRYYIPGVLRFEVDDRTYSFATGITDIEAFRLIDCMLEICDFPKERAQEYIGIRQ